MNIKQKRSSKPKFLIVSVGIFALAFTGGVLFASRHEKPVAANNTEVKSMFAFTPPKGWRQGPHNQTSMAAFSPARADGTSACFTSAEYYTGTVNLAKAIQKDTDGIIQGGNTVTQLRTQPLTIQTYQGPKQYELHQYSVNSPSSSTIMGGHAIGFVSFDSGHLKIYANCNTAEELPTTIDALQAYTLQNV